MKDIKNVMSYGHDMYIKGVTAGVISTVSLYISYRLLKEYWTRDVRVKDNSFNRR